jgi:hypothetical protein
MAGTFFREERGPDYPRLPADRLRRRQARAKREPRRDTVGAGVGGVRARRGEGGARRGERSRHSRCPRCGGGRVVVWGVPLTVGCDEDLRVAPQSLFGSWEKHCVVKVSRNGTARLG